MENDCMGKRFYQYMQLFAATVHGDCLSKASALCRRAGRTPTHGRDLVNARTTVGGGRGARRSPRCTPPSPAMASWEWRRSCQPGRMPAAAVAKARRRASAAGWGRCKNHGRLPRRRRAQPPRSCPPLAVTMSCCRRQRWRRWRHAGIPPVVSRRCLRAGAWLSPTVGKFASTFAKGLTFGPNVQPKPHRGRRFAPHRAPTPCIVARVSTAAGPRRRPPGVGAQGGRPPLPWTLRKSDLVSASHSPRLCRPPRGRRKVRPPRRVARPPARPPAPTLAARSAAAGRVRASLPRPAWRAAVEWLARTPPQIAAAAPPAGRRARSGRRGRRPSTGRLEPAADPRAFVAVSPASRSRCSTT